MSTKDKLQALVAVLVIGGFLWGGMNYFARAADLQLVELRLDQKIMSDQIINTKRQMWQLEERNKSCKEINEWDDRDRKQYKELDMDLQMLMKKQDAMIKK
jgi:hypothetical protein